MNTPDATLIAALETLLHELTEVTSAVGVARRDLVPATATFWAGHARREYDREVVDLRAAIDAVAGILDLARRSTSLAIAEASAHD